MSPWATVQADLDQCGQGIASRRIHGTTKRRPLDVFELEEREARARAIGPETLALIKDVFDQDPVLSHLRQAQAIVRPLERFPAWRAEFVSRRARQTGDLSYQGIRQALSEGEDLLAAVQEPESRTSSIPSSARSSPKW